MPSQQAEIAETIAALKRALKRNHRTPSSAPISQASNRGNKLKRGAQYVHQGALAYIKGPEVYKEKINHAGYSRYILEQKPRRFNDFGDEVEESESEEEADVWGGDENAYSGLKLEDLLCPLKHPSELPVHPTLSQAYLSTALPDMIESTYEQLREEKANLWRAKDLHRQLIGDEAWVPCEAVETPEDEDIFEPKRPINALEQTRGTKRKQGDMMQEGSTITASTVTTDGGPPPYADVAAKTGDSVVPLSSAKHGTGMGTPNVEEHGALQMVEKKLASKTLEDVSSARAPELPEDEQKFNATQATDLTNHEPMTGEPNNDHAASGDVTTAAGGAEPREQEEDATEVGAVAGRSGSASPAPPTRRITRALAQTNNNNGESNGSAAPTPPLSPTTSTSSMQIHPLYLIPPLRSQFQQTPYNLPPAEHSDTLSLLTSYIQKQSAFINALNSVLTRLLQANRLRETVFQWCKVEGHAGELSDGEDWIDEAAWGLDVGELKKGKGDEEDMEVQEGYMGRGNKGKRRRGAGAG